MHVRDGELERASESLAEFVFEQAQQTATDVGFEWVESSMAPSTFDNVLDAYIQSCDTQEPYRIASVGSGTSIYPDPAVNAAFRFWHDVTHVRLLCSFDYWDERAVAEHHLDRLEVHGFARGSLEWRLFRADTLGQNEFHRLSGGFVEDQRAFALAAVEHGLGIAVLHELHRTEPGPPAHSTRRAWSEAA